MFGVSCFGFRVKGVGYKMEGLGYRVVGGGGDRMCGVSGYGIHLANHVKKSHLANHVKKRQVKKRWNTMSPSPPDSGFPVCPRGGGCKV